MVLGDIMHTRVVSIGPDETADAAWTRMRRRGIRHLVVMDGGELVGIISERDLGGRNGAGVRAGRTVGKLMTRRVTSAGPDTTLTEAADRMREELVGSLPVVEDGQLLGIVTATDVFDALGNGAMGPLSGAERQLLRAPTSSRRLGGRPLVRSRSEGGKGRGRSAGDEPREPLARRVSKAVKRAAGRTGAAQTPANIRVSGVTLSQDDRAYIRQRLGDRLGKYAESIERVTVRVEDVNGPRGGVDQACRIKVVLSGHPSVMYEHRADSLKPAVTRALNGVERAVRRVLERQRP